MRRVLSVRSAGLALAVAVTLGGCKHCSPPVVPAARLLGVTSCCPNEFVVIEPATGAFTNFSAVGDAEFGFPVGASDVDSGGDTYFIVRHNAGTPHVLSIDTNTGSFVESPPLSLGLLALGFDSNAGQLVGVTSCCLNEFVDVDAATGGLVSFANVGDATFGFAAGAAAVDPATNRFFMIRSQAGIPHLISIDTLTGALTQTPALSSGIMKLGFDQDDNVLVGVTSCCPNQFVHIDTATGALTVVSNVGDSGFGFSAGASAIDSASNRLFLARSQSGTPHVIAVDTLTGAVTESPALSKNLLSLGFDGP